MLRAYTQLLWTERERATKSQTIVGWYIRVCTHTKNTETLVRPTLGKAVPTGGGIYTRKYDIVSGYVSPIYEQRLMHLQRDFSNIDGIITVMPYVRSMH